MVKYVGQRHTVIQYDDRLFQWNMTVVNNPSLHAFSTTELSSLCVGTHNWTIMGDIGCNTRPQQLRLSLREIIFVMCCNCNWSMFFLINEP